MIGKSSRDISEEIIKKKDRLFSKTIHESESILRRQAKESIYPLILGCYKGASEKDLELLKESIKEEYPNVRLLKDIPDIDRIDNNRKFKHFIKDIRGKQGFVFPIICLHKAIDQGKGIGLINEIRDITDVLPHSLILKTLILKERETEKFEHINYFPNIEETEDIGKSSSIVLTHINKHIGWIEHRCLINSCNPPEDFYSSGSIYTKKGDENG